MNKLQVLKIVVCLLLLSVSATAQTPVEDDEFLPTAKTRLRGRQLDARWFEDAANSKQKKDTRITEDPASPIDLRSMIVSEMQKVRSGSLPEQVKAGLSSSFKDTIAQVTVEGRFEILSLNSPINDNYIRTIEGAIRSNVYPPIIARANQQKLSVAVLFTVKQDGKISDIEKESSTGSNALDAAAISACRSSSPLPPPPANPNAKEDIIRMRFTLTYNP